MSAWQPQQEAARCPGTAVSTHLVSYPSQLLTLLTRCLLGVSCCRVCLCAVCRHRLSRALTAWHASDGSARILLGPWAKVFEPQDWENLMSRCILPKLAAAMQTVSGRVCDGCAAAGGAV